jgi:hypothetical protein
MVRVPTGAGSDRERFSGDRYPQGIPCALCIHLVRAQRAGIAHPGWALPARKSLREQSRLAS